MGQVWVGSWEQKSGTCHRLSAELRSLQGFLGMGQAEFTRLSSEGAMGCWEVYVCESSQEARESPTPGQFSNI